MCDAVRHETLTIIRDINSKKRYSGYLPLRLMPHSRLRNTLLPRQVGLSLHVHLTGLGAGSCHDIWQRGC